LEEEKKETKKKKKSNAGRPTLYKPEYCERLISHMKKGYPFSTFCLETDQVVSPDVLYFWLDDHEEFLQAKKVGEQAGLKFHLDMLIDAMTVKKYFKNFIPACWIFKMKNMHNIKVFKLTNKYSPEKLNPNPFLSKLEIIKSILFLNTEFG